MEHTVLELPSGSIATIGGLDIQTGGNLVKEILVLMESEWTKIGDLLQVRLISEDIK